MTRKRKRDYIPLREKLAAALWELLPTSQRQDMILAHGAISNIPARQVIALWEFHHFLQHALEGSSRWHNIMPMLIADHRARTPGDIKTVAKVKRISAAHKDFRRRALKVKKRPKPKSRWPKRQWLHGPLRKKAR